MLNPVVVLVVPHGLGDLSARGWSCWMPVLCVCVCVCVSMHACAHEYYSMHRGQLGGHGSFFLPRGFWGLNSGHLAW